MQYLTNNPLEHFFFFSHSMPKLFSVDSVRSDYSQVSYNQCQRKRELVRGFNALAKQVLSLFSRNWRMDVSKSGCSGQSRYSCQLLDDRTARIDKI